VATFSYTLSLTGGSLFNACVTYGTTRRSYQPGSRRLHCAPGAYCVGNGPSLYLSQSWAHRLRPHPGSQIKHGANGAGRPPVGRGLWVAGVSCPCAGFDDNDDSFPACRQQPVAGGKRGSIRRAYSGKYVDDPNRSLPRLRYDTDHCFGLAPESCGGGYYHGGRYHSLWSAQRAARDGQGTGRFWSHLKPLVTFAFQKDQAEAGIAAVDFKRRKSARLKQIRSYYRADFPVSLYRY